MVLGGWVKTALAQLAYSDERVVKYLELKMWVCVSDNFDVKMFVKKILKSISNEDVESLKLNGLKNKLHEKKKAMRGSCLCSMMCGIKTLKNGMI